MVPRTPIRHGEILLLPIPSTPAGVVQRVTECIVGHSETGHHHVLESDVLFQQIIAGGNLYVDLDAPTPLRHRKQFRAHRELSVPAGAWRVIRKTEFDAKTFPEAPDLDIPAPDPTPRPNRRYVRD